MDDPSRYASRRDYEESSSYRAPWHQTRREGSYEDEYTPQQASAYDYDQRPLANPYGPGSGSGSGYAREAYPVSGSSRSQGSAGGAYPARREDPSYAPREEHRGGPYYQRRWEDDEGETRYTTGRPAPRYATTAGGQPAYVYPAGGRETAPRQSSRNYSGRDEPHSTPSQSQQYANSQGRSQRPSQASYYEPQDEYDDQRQQPVRYNTLPAGPAYPSQSQGRSRYSNVEQPPAYPSGPASSSSAFRGEPRNIEYQPPRMSQRHTIDVPPPERPVAPLKKQTHSYPIEAARERPRFFSDEPLSIRGRTDSFRTSKSKKGPELVEEYYSRYNMTWPVLSRWLEKTFPGMRFEQKKDATRDEWVFRIPRRLTSDDRRQLKALETGN